jgi:glutamyl/glutaminyl-tRNA synthetase
MPPCVCGSAPVTHFNDLLSGEIHADERLAREDFIIHRRDGLFAYNLAVVVDDHFRASRKLCAAQIWSNQPCGKYRCITSLAGQTGLHSSAAGGQCAG